MQDRKGMVRLLQTIAGYLVSAVIAYEVTVYLSAQAKAGHDMGWLARTISSAPGQVWVLSAFAVIALIYLFWPALSQWWHARKVSVQTESPVVPSDVANDADDRDAGELPQFIAEVHEIQLSDPVVGPDLFAAVILTITNDGAPSVARTFRATARAVYGANVTVDVFSYPTFAIYLNKGKDCIDYTEQHYIMQRTHGTPIKRGVPVTGILPCIFRGITDPKQIDVRSFKVNFVDGIRGSEKTPRVWTSEDVRDDIQYSEVIQPTMRPGLPVIHPVGTPGY